MTYASTSALYPWGNLLPLPSDAKKPVPAGFTGRAGRDVTADDAAGWAGRDGNYALRLPGDVVGIDVDTYAGKDGAGVLAELEEKLGALPPTYMSTSRGEPLKSGIRFYRYAGGTLTGKAGVDIDVIQRGHRYAVVWPSTVEDRAYLWYAPDGSPAGLPPEKTDLAILPEAWENHLRQGASTYEVQPAAVDTTEEFAAAMAADDREPCEEVTEAVKVAAKRFKTLADGSHHDSMLAGLHGVVRSASKGHPGYAAAVEQLRKLWAAAGLGDARDVEFERMVTGAVAKAATEQGGTYTPQTGSEHFCESKVAPLPPEWNAEDTDEAPTEGGNGGGGNNGGDDGSDNSGDEPDWVNDLQTDTKGQLLDSYFNTALIMRNDEVLRHIGSNTMGGGLAWRKLPSWRIHHPNPFKRRDINLDDADIERIYQILRGYYGGRHTSLKEETCKSALMSRAAENSFSPWKDYLDALPAWDGVRRIEEAIPTVHHNDYTRQAMANFFLGMMERCYEPGAQVDSMLVLWGAQGVRKTSWLRALVPDETMYAELETIPDANRGKDQLAASHRAAIVVLDELDKLRRRDEQSALKAFITGRADTWRAPYGRVNSTHARQFVLAGTTNEAEFLLDATGNRRYWPVRVEDRIPAEALTREHMDALLAEARDRYRRGERVVYAGAFEGMAEQAREENLHDPIGEAIYAWLDDPKSSPAPVAGGIQMAKVDVSLVSMNMLMDYVPDLAAVDRLRDKQATDRIAAAMDRHPGYRRAALPPGGRLRVGGKRGKKAWERI